MHPRKIGLLVNPIAGMGGAVGLKGTTLDVLPEAIRRGARPRAPQRALDFLHAVKADVQWVTCAGEMGESALEEAGESCMVAYSPGTPTTPADTRAGALALVEAEVDLIVFVGGDGTATDIARAVDRRVPILGVPSGAKMYSAIFAETPQAAALVVSQGWDATEEREVLDIDEDAFRRDELRVAFKAITLAPAHAAVQVGKVAGADNDVEQETLAEALAEEMEPGVTYVIGAGTTLYRVKEKLGDGTLLGIDAYRDGKLVAKDAGERELLTLPDPLLLIVSPIGHQGFVFGRGNLPLTPRIIRRAGAHGVVVAATPTKLQGLAGLHVDTGDPELDAQFGKYFRVTTGYGARKLMPVLRASTEASP